MAAINESVNRPEYAPNNAFFRTFTAGEKIFSGTLAALGEDGKIHPASKAGGRIVGVARMNGIADAPVMVRAGHFEFENDTVKPVGIEHIDKVVYVKDEVTVSADDGDSGGTGTPVNAVAGVLRAIDFSTRKPIVEVGQMVHK